MIAVESQPVKLADLQKGLTECCCGQKDANQKDGCSGESASDACRLTEEPDRVLLWTEGWLPWRVSQ